MEIIVGQSEKFGKLIYTTPAGWKLTKYQNGARITPADLPAKEYLSIEILQPINFSATMKQALENSYDETCNILQVTKMFEASGASFTALEPKISFRGWEYVRCSGGIKLNNGTPYPDEYGLDLFVIKVNNRFERVAIVKSRNTCGGLSRYYSSDRRNYHDVIEKFLFSLQFTDWREPVVKPGTVKDDGITAVWQGISMSVGISKPGAGLGAELDKKQLILFSNGQAYFGKNFPSEGLHELNTWIQAENNRRDWGTYSYNNGRGILKMPYGDIPVRMDKNKLVITTNKTDHPFIKLSGVDYVKFSGTYTLEKWNGMIPTITFNTDGKFADNGAIRVLYQEYIDCLNPALAPGSGMYEVKNHSLIFNYTDGRKIKIAFTESVLDKNNVDPSSILSFNNNVLRKQ